MPLTEDFGRWVYWWEFNKERYLGLRDAVHGVGVVTASDDFYMGAGRVRERSLEPSDGQIRTRVLPALVETLENTRDREVVAECLIALAKIGRDAESVSLVSLIEPHLGRRDARVRESAILALGISQRDDAFESLNEILADSARGRDLVRRDSVSRRSRAFAAYALGCIGAATRDDGMRRRVAQALHDGLAEPDPDVDVRVASMHALGALDLDLGRRADRRVLASSVHALMRFYESELGASTERIQAHAPTSVAKLLMRAPDAGLVAWAKSRLVRELSKTDSKRRGRHVTRSALIGLGLLSKRVDDESAADYANANLLWNEYREGKDEQSRAFSLIAMAQMGGRLNRDRLLHALRGRSMQRPWAALALGVLSYDERARELDGSAEPLVVDALRRVLRERKNPELLASAAIALGLCGADEATPELREMLQKYRQQSFLGGYLCTSLAMLDDDIAADSIQSTVLAAQNQPKLLRRGAIALALLGQKQTGDELVGILREGDAPYSRVAAVAPALSRIGDRNVVDPLVNILDEGELTDSSRSMIALALGGIADKEALPWYVRYAENANYRATVSSLAGAGNGVLDRY